MPKATVEPPGGDGPGEPMPGVLRAIVYLCALQILLMAVAGYLAWTRLKPMEQDPLQAWISQQGTPSKTHDGP